MILIAAMDAKRGIGKNNTIPWKLPEDMRFFKQATTGHCVIMGRKTFDSIGKPLPYRYNIVVTRNTEWHFSGVKVASSLEAALELAKKELFVVDVHNAELASHQPQIFVIGGGELYAAALPLADGMYLTEINQTYDCDTFFPEFDKDDWHKQVTAHSRSIVNDLEYSFMLYRRK